MKVKSCITITWYFTEEHFIMQMSKGMTATIVARDILCTVEIVFSSLEVKRSFIVQARNAGLVVKAFQGLLAYLFIRPGQNTKKIIPNK